MTKLIKCELCDKIAQWTIQATEVAGSEYNGKVYYYCSEHYHETIKELEGKA